MLKFLIKQLFIKLDRHDEKFKFIAAGCFNTVSSYFLSIFLYYIFLDKVKLIYILIFIYILSIIISFLTYNFFVFKPSKNIFFSFIKFFSMYGFFSIAAIFSVWILVDFLLIEFWIAQLAVLIVTIVLSYFGNKRFVFVK